MAYTYTRTYTKEEYDMRDLNVSVFSLIKSPYGKENYFKLTSEGKASDIVQNNYYDSGILIGDGFTIMKKEGRVDLEGEDIIFDYLSREGQISSYGSEYAKAKVKLPEKEAVYLTDFSDNPDVEAFVNQVKERLIELSKQEKKEPTK